MCHSFINECILHLADQGQVPEKCVIAKRGRENISMCQDSYVGGFVGEFAVFSKDQAFS